MLNQCAALRGVVTAILCGGLTAAPLTYAATTHAKPKPICNLLTDPAGDVNVVVPNVGPQAYPDPGLDVLSVDVASDAKRLGVTLRLNSAPGQVVTTDNDVSLFLRYLVFITFRSTGRELIFGAVKDFPDDAVGNAASENYPGGWQFGVGNFADGNGFTYSEENYGAFTAAHGVIDVAGKAIRMSVTWAALKKKGYLRTPGDRLVGIRARAQDILVAQYRGQGLFDPGNYQWDDAPRDEATTKHTYPLGAKTCIAILP